MIKRNIALMFVFCLIIILIPTASAVRLGPGRAILEFQPGLELNYSFHVASDKDEPMYHEIDIIWVYAEEPTLKPYVEWDEPILEEFQPGERKQYSVMIRLPKTLEPGDHRFDIIAHPSIPPDAREGTSFAYARVRAPFIVRVPYPGLYAKIDKLTVPAVAELDQKKEFVALIHNYGEQDIVAATGELRITNPFSEMIYSSSTNTESLKATEKKELYTYWTPKDVPLGIYNAEIELKYDGGNSYTKDKNFTVGDELIEITATPNLELVKDTIKSTQIRAKSFWSDTIENVYFEVKLEDKRFKSESVDFELLGEQNLTIFIDPTGIEPGEYKAEAILYYGDKTDTEEFDVTIKSFSKKFLYGISGIIIAVIAVLAIIFFFLKGKH